MSELWVNLNEALEFYTPSPNDDDFDKAWIRSTRRYLKSVAVDVETIGDGYHTFSDLYEQRIILSAALAKNNPYAWKSKLHEDGSLPFGGGWFIMGFDTADGEYTYHYELKDWDLFECKEIPCGKPWDGHTSKDVRRLLSLPTIERRGEWFGGEEMYLCSCCWEQEYIASDFCPNCGADMRGERDGQ